MHHLSHLTNDYVHLLKGRAPSSTLKVSSHTLSSVCYYNRPEDVGELAGGVTQFIVSSIILQPLLHSGDRVRPFFWVQILPIYARRETVDSFEFGNSDDNWEEESVLRKKLISFNCFIT